uniref:Reverse transcriptase domain-containing protein n=1 Tax=Tanacetum cinerariifolium TaxID=118510 RepID=A0A699H539_TANCI|nr:hypothetical protein [Tanacetum cinerariifolium]
MAMTSGRGRLKEDFESSTWRRRQDFKAPLSCRHLYKYNSAFRILVGNFGITLYKPRETNPSHFRSFIGTIEKEGPEGAEPRIKHNEEHAPRPSIFYQPSKSSNLPSLSRVKKQKKDNEDERLLSIFKLIHINMPFLKAMIHMPKGAKVLKDLLSHKEKLEKAASSVKLSEEVPYHPKKSAQKRRRPMKLHTAMSHWTPVLEMDEDELVPIILGWPFLATTRAVIDVHEGKLSLRVRSETATFNIRKSMKSKHSRDDYLYCTDHTANIFQEQWVNMVDNDGKLAEVEEEEDSNEVQAISFYPSIELVEPLKLKASKNRLKPSSIKPPKLELKELPEHLEREETNLVLNWEKCYFMVKEGIILDHKVLSVGIESDHLSWLENPDLGKLTKAEIKDILPDERLMAVSDKHNHPLYADYANYLASRINELEKMRLDAYESSISYKERTKRWHGKRIKAPTNNERGDKVRLFNSCLRLFLDKLKSIWYRRSLVSKDMKNGAIELHDKDGNEFIVNKQ